jgi:succinate dehydrogenase / fumarate reductase cytochrome b subunit
MTHNIFIKVLSYLTYASILFHAVDGIMLTIQNKKARPVKYAYNKPNTNSSGASRSMALLGSAILIFIVIHMSNFWGVMHFGSIPLHKVSIETPNSPDKAQLYKLQSNVVLNNVPGGLIPIEWCEDSPQGPAQFEIRSQTEFYLSGVDIKVGEGYKDLHSLTLAFFGVDKSHEGMAANKYGLIAVVLYVLSMIVLSFHLWHGFASAFQSLGINHKNYTPAIQLFGRAFSILVPLGFAIIPSLLYLNR